MARDLEGCKRWVKGVLRNAGDSVSKFVAAVRREKNRPPDDFELRALEEVRPGARAEAEEIIRGGAAATPLAQPQTVRPTGSSVQPRERVPLT